MVFIPFSFRSGLTVKNRTVVAPMTTYASLENGELDPLEDGYLERRAAGGFGMVMTAACYVHPSGHAFQGQWACSDDRFLPSLQRAADAIHRGGSVAVLQIHHGGRQCPSRLCGGQPWSASAIPSERPNAEVPHAMTEEEIETIVESYAAAALRAKQAGFDGVEIHGANTYLLQQFFSPHSNRREDAWGLDRKRFPLAVAEAVLAAVGPRFSVGYRFSPEELENPGIDWPQTESLIDALANLPLDYLHISLGKYDQGSIRGEYEDPTLVRAVRTLNGRMPLIGVGSVKRLEDAERCLELGASLVAIGRAAITDPEWPLRAMAGEEPRLTVPAEGAQEKLTLPKGLADKIYAVEGWFDVEKPSATAAT